MLVIYGGGDPHLNVSSVKMSPHLNVGYLWWWGPMPECFKWKKLTMPKCSLFGWWEPMPECFKYKKVTVTKCWLFGVVGAHA